MRLRPFISLCVALLCTLPSLGASGADLNLADAVEQRDRDAFKRLLTQKADVNASQADGMTALHWAVYLDDLEVVQKLLDLGADVKAGNRYEVTPLSTACMNGNEKIVRLLLEHGADANAKLNGGETVLMTAARTGVAGPVISLLKHGAEVEAKERRGQTALMWAAAEGNLEVVNILLDADAEYSAPLPSGYTPMLFAIREGRIGVTKRFLQAGVDVNAAMKPIDSPSKGVKQGTSPLILAIENGHFELAIELLKAGALPNDDRTHFTPLHTMSWIRKPPFGDNADGDPSPIGSGNVTSLQFIRTLVTEFGADVSYAKKNGSGGRGKYGKKGTTPFLCAAGTGDLPFLKLLIELGANPTVTNDIGWTALSLASGIGTGSEGCSAGLEPECLDAVEFLVDLGVDVNAVDRNGETAMHGAAYKSMPRVAKFLHEHGADIKIWSVKSKQGRTPLSIAQGYRGKGNFKPSFETVNAISEIMLSQGYELPPPPGKHSGNYN